MADKKGLPPAVAFALMVLMIVCALCIGANKGWTKERAAADEVSAQLENALTARTETAYNLLTVAGRHMAADDALTVAVKEDATAMKNGNAALSARAEACARFRADADALLQALAALDTVRKDSRDDMYVTQMLPLAVEQCMSEDAQNAYNESADAYNRRLRGGLSGWLARLTGVQYMPLFVSP